MKKNILTFAVVIFAIVVINQIFILTTTYFSPKIIPPQIQNRKEGQEDSPPYSAAWMKWKTINPELDIQAISRMPLQNLATITNGTFTQSALDGYEWLAVEEFKSDKDYENAKDLISYYIETLGKDGWKITEQIDQTTITGKAINAPKGNFFSMVRAISGKFQLFAFSSQRDNETCPCKITHRIFVTQSIPINKIVKQINKENE